MCVTEYLAYNYLDGKFGQEPEDAGTPEPVDRPQDSHRPIPPRPSGTRRAINKTILTGSGGVANQSANTTDNSLVGY